MSILANSIALMVQANTLEDCENLIKKKVDYIGLGPYKFTSTKTNLSPILGLEGYQTILDALKTDTPIIAIGGITLSEVSTILDTGVFGIAVSEEITKDFNTISAFNQIINGPTLEQRYTFDKDKNDE